MPPHGVTMSTTARKRAQSGLRAAGRKGGQARKKKTTTRT